MDKMEAVKREQTNTGHNRWALKKWMAAVCLSVLMALMLSGAASAKTAGWSVTAKGNTIYCKADSAGTLRRVKGLVQIGNYYYYFNRYGVLQTGWVSTSDGYRYFRANGGPGVRGRMYRGFRKVNGYYYYFNKTTGVVTTGMVKLAKNSWFFSTAKRIGLRGRAVRNKWKKVNGSWYYFGSNGAMLRNCWVGGTYYVGSNGKRLMSTVTPDGYLVGKTGKKVSSSKVNGWVRINGKYYYYNLKKKTFLYKQFIKLSGGYYYVDAKGVRATGWKTISGSKYYFSKTATDGYKTGQMVDGRVTVDSKTYYFKKGVLQTGKTVDGYTTNASGVITAYPKAKILVVAGHGNGDPGAVSTLGYEYKVNREFASLLVKYLKAGSDLTVTYFQNGSTSYNLYALNASLFGSSGLNIVSSITGAGSAASKVKSGLRSSSSVPNLDDYDYVIEVHFNATAASQKDLTGDGTMKGFCCYVNQYKKKTALESDMVARMRAAGYKIFGCGVFASSGLLNARICTEVGTDYTLIETGFIDDYDDMKFYNKNKNAMARAIANAIINYYE